MKDWCLEVMCKGWWLELGKPARSPRTSMQTHCLYWSVSRTILFFYPLLYLNGHHTYLFPCLSPSELRHSYLLFPPAQDHSCLFIQRTVTSDVCNPLRDDWGKLLVVYIHLALHLRCASISVWYRWIYLDICNPLRDDWAYLLDTDAAHHVWLMIPYSWAIGRRCHLTR